MFTCKSRCWTNRGDKNGNKGQTFHKNDLTLIQDVRWLSTFRKNRGKKAENIVRAETPRVCFPQVGGTLGVGLSMMY